MRFVNPYNFVPLTGTCERKNLKGSEGKTYTGYFDCKMELLTPVFIPNTSSSRRLITKEDVKKEQEEKAKRNSQGHKRKEDENGKTEENEWKGYDFFSYEDYSEQKDIPGKLPDPPRNPVIPGSEIRGAVRSVFEAAFRGCMSSVDLKRELSRRCAEVKTPGILYRDENGWHLRECRKARLPVEQKGEKNKYIGKNIPVLRNTYREWEEGKKIWFNSKRRRDGALITEYECNEKSGKKKGYQLGYLHKGEYIKRKNCEAIFYETNESEWMDVPEEAVELLKRVLKEYQDGTKNIKLRRDGWYSDFHIYEDGRKVLVYFSLIIPEDQKHQKGQKNQRSSFPLMCPACIGREAFAKTVVTLLRQNGAYQPCNSDELCPACQIFGMVGKSENSENFSYGSKIRITDAFLENSVAASQELFEDPLILPEAGQPKPSAVEFYTESPYENEGEKLPDTEGYWTYDYRYQFGKNIKDIKRIALKSSFPRIRGRKFYWHKEVELQEVSRKELNEMCQRVRPIKTSKETNGKSDFRFRVYFEKLNKMQLAQLKWSLDFENPDCAHKIGKGKPLGFGSVKIIVQNMTLREIGTGNHCRTLKIMKEEGEFGYDQFFKDSGFSEEGIPEELKVMVNWKNKPNCVNYPQVEHHSVEQTEKINETASHQWFQVNKKGSTFVNCFKQVLPTALEDADPNLPKGKALYNVKNRNKS